MTKKLEELPDEAEFQEDVFVDNDHYIRYYTDKKGRRYSELYKRVDIELEDE